EAGRRINVLSVGIGADAQKRLAIAQAEIAPEGGPGVRLQAVVGDDAGRGERAKRPDMAQNARRKRAGRLGKLAGALGIPGHRPALAILQAEVNVDAVARHTPGDERREAGPEAVASGDGAADLAQLDGAVGGLKGGRRIERHLVLPGPILRQVGFRRQPVGPQGANELGAEGLDAAQGAESIGIAAALLCTFQVELMLEAGEDLEPHLLLEPGKRAPQKRTQAAIPVLSLQRPDLPEKPVLHRRAVAEVEHDLGAVGGHQEEIAMGTEGGLRNAPKAVDHDIGRRPADTEAPALFQVPGREAFAPHLPRNIGAADVDQLLRFYDHGSLSFAYRGGSRGDPSSPASPRWITPAARFPPRQTSRSGRKRWKPASAVPCFPGCRRWCRSRPGSPAFRPAHRGLRLDRRFRRARWHWRSGRWRHIPAVRRNSPAHGRTSR